YISRVWRPLVSVPGAIRTPDRRLRRPLLYPAELRGHENGAGDGNRTHDISLEGWGFTTKLHPHHSKINAYVLIMDLSADKFYYMHLLTVCQYYLSKNFY